MFTEDEEEQVKSLFGLTDDSLKLVIDGCSYVFEQVLYISCIEILFYPRS